MWTQPTRAVTQHQHQNKPGPASPRLRSPLLGGWGGAHHPRFPSAPSWSSLGTSYREGIGRTWQTLRAVPLGCSRTGRRWEGHTRSQHGFPGADISAPSLLPVPGGHQPCRLSTCPLLPPAASEPRCPPVNSHLIWGFGGPGHSHFPTFPIYQLTADRGGSVAPAGGQGDLDQESHDVAFGS